MRYPREVYAIKHKPTGRIYIGSSYSAKDRVYQHLYRLKRGTHPCINMQRDYDEYHSNEKDYELTILDRIEDFSQRSKEFQWMEKLHTIDERIGYNGEDPHYRNCDKKSCYEEVNAIEKLMPEFKVGEAFLLILDCVSGNYDETQSYKDWMSGKKRRATKPIKYKRCAEMKVDADVYKEFSQELYAVIEKYHNKFKCK